VIVSERRSGVSRRGYVITPLSNCDDLLAFHQLNPKRYPHLLESVVHGTDQARYDILFAFPGQHLALDSRQHLFLDDEKQDDTDFLAVLDRRWGDPQDVEHVENSADQEQPPFRGGWFIFLAYEFVGQIEKKLKIKRSDDAVPLAMATRFPAAIIRDHKLKTAYLVCESNRQNDIVPAVEADSRALSKYSGDQELNITGLTEETPERFLQGVDRIKNYIREGDVFQVNLSRLWRGRLAGHSNGVQLYRRLRRSNPAPFAGLMTLTPTTQIISSSPERLVSVVQGKVSTRPIAGTHPRGKDGAEDKLLSAQLLAHPKERAEHVMLIDLERNDLGRICQPGSVAVKDFMILESYRHVHHIVSEIHGTLGPGISPAAVIRAVFPGGTITGCPKVRCMEIINELEDTARGAYTGAMGYINHNGDMDLNILIRTLTKEGDTVHWRAGSGIVSDSVPDLELDETRAKAKGLLSALQEMS